MLTMLGLLIGFSFSMAVGRYDLRKNKEEAEANAIGTEYVRADLLADADAAKVLALLRTYLDQRILFYTIRGSQAVAKNNADTAALQDQLSQRAPIWRKSCQIPYRISSACLFSSTGKPTWGLPS
jgi:hypothetical protein